MSKRFFLITAHAALLASQPGLANEKTAARTADVGVAIATPDEPAIIFKFYWEGGPEEGVDIERAQFTSNARGKVVIRDICCITKRTDTGAIGRNNLVHQDNASEGKMHVVQMSPENLKVKELSMLSRRNGEVKLTGSSLSCDLVGGSSSGGALTSARGGPIKGTLIEVGRDPAPTIVVQGTKLTKCDDGEIEIGFVSMAITEKGVPKE